MQTITLKGTMGSTYEFEIYPMSRFGSFDCLESVEAVYVFARQKSNKKFRAVYIGETKNVDDRLDEDHHQIDCIREKKATHIFIYRDEEDPLLEEAYYRRIIEDDLMHYRPECQPDRWPAD